MCRRPQPPRKNPSCASPELRPSPLAGKPSTAKESAAGVCDSISPAFLLMAVVQHIQGVPAPVDAVTPDQAVLDLHDLDEIHLVAIGRDARIFPGHDAAIGEKSLLEALALRRVGLEHARDEFPQVVLSLHD